MWSPTVALHCCWVNTLHQKESIQTALIHNTRCHVLKHTVCIDWSDMLHTWTSNRWALAKHKD
jgi:hypothetical protein